MAFVGAQNQPDRRVFAGQCPILLGIVAVHVHLPRVGMRQLAQLQVNDDEAAQTPVKQQQVNAIPGLVNPQPALPPDKGEIAAKLQQKVPEPVNQRVFKLGLGVFVLEVQELQHIGVFDGLIGRDCIFGSWSDTFSEHGRLVAR